MKKRLLLMAVLALTWNAGVVARLYQVQVADHAAYAQRAERQQQRVVEIDPPRGTIYDARGRELAVSVEVESAFAVPREVRDPAAAAARLAPVLGLDAGALASQLAAEREFVWVKRKLDPPDAAAVRALGIEGIRFLEEYRRYYPMRELAAPVVGFVGLDNQGLAGLEFAYDEQVAGHRGRRKVVRDARRGTLVVPTERGAGAEAGVDLRLTLDASVQYVAERELARAVEEQGARGGSAVLLDPRNGAVLAMASYPSFDPNRFADFPEERRRNAPVMNAYEPGSTFKMVTAAAVLEANVLDPGDELDCGMGRIVLYGTTIRDHKPFGTLSFRQVLARSSNVGVIRAALRLDRAVFHATIEGFGFGRPTGIDLPGENAGILRPLEKWLPLTPAYVSFGQGIAVTPLQMAAAFGAVANGGTLYRPYAVEARGRGGVWQPLHSRPEAVHHPLSRSAARELGRMLEGVVADGATGERAAIAGYRVAGKTGTAQTAESGGHGYSASRRVPNFAGYAPARNPAVVGLVVIDSPTAGPTGGAQVAAPVFARIVERVLLYLGVPPEDRPPPGPWPGERPREGTLERAGLLDGTAERAQEAEDPRRLSRFLAETPAAAPAGGVG